MSIYNICEEKCVVYFVVRNICGKKIWWNCKNLMLLLFMKFSSHGNFWNMCSKRNFFSSELLYATILFYILCKPSFCYHVQYTKNYTYFCCLNLLFKSRFWLGTLHISFFDVHPINIITKWLNFIVKVNMQIAERNDFS